MANDRETLLDILDATRLIVQYVEGMTVAQLRADLRTQDAVVWRFQIIGEATRRLSEDFRSRHPAIPWGKMAAMRNSIVHGYDSINWDVV